VTFKLKGGKSHYQTGIGGIFTVLIAVGIISYTLDRFIAMFSYSEYAVT